MKPAGAGLTQRARFGYGVGMYGPMLGWVAGLQYLMYFYTDVAGISPARAGIIFMTGMIWDAVSDPLVGHLADQTRTRWGRYRPYLLFAAAPFGLSVFLVFSTPAGASGAVVFWYAMLTALLFRTGYTLVYMPLTAMIARMTTDYDARMGLTSIKTLFTFLANLSISFLFYTLVEFFGAGDEAAGFPRAAAVVGMLGMCTIWVCFRATREDALPERPHSVAEVSPLAQLRRGLAALFANRAFVVLFCGVAVFGGFYGMCLASVAYLAKYWLGDAALTKYLFTAQALASLASIPGWLALSRLRSKRAVWVAGISLAAASLFAIYLLRPDDPWLMALLYALMNAGAAGFIAVFYAMTADTVDWGEWIHGTRLEGVTFGAISLANKFSAGIATGAMGAGLAAVGFVANELPGPAVIDGLFLIGTAIPAAGFLLAVALIAGYPVSRDAHARAVRDLAARGLAPGR